MKSLSERTEQFHGSEVRQCLLAMTAVWTSGNRDTTAHMNGPEAATVVGCLPISIPPWCVPGGPLLVQYVRPDGPLVMSSRALLVFCPDEPWDSLTYPLTPMGGYFSYLWRNDIMAFPFGGATYDPLVSPV